MEAVLRCGPGRHRLDEAFLLARTNRNDDFVRRKGREGVANGEIEVRLSGNSIDRVAGELLGRVLGYPFRVAEGFLVVRKPVEYALPHDRHDDLDRVGLPDMSP